MHAHISTHTNAHTTAQKIHARTGTQLAILNPHSPNPGRIYDRFDSRFDGLVEAVSATDRDDIIHESRRPLKATPCTMRTNPHPHLEHPNNWQAEPPRTLMEAYLSDVGRFGGVGSNNRAAFDESMALERRQHARERAETETLQRQHQKLEAVSF